MGLGANIWSETGGGEGKPGDSRRWGRGRKTFSGFILAMWGRAGPLSSQKSWRVLLGWGQLNPGEAQGIPAELKEGGHSQKERALFEKSR